MSMSEFQIRPIEKDDHALVAAFVRGQWGTTKVVSRGRIYWADQLPGVLAMQADRLVGLVTYNIEDEECEIVTLDSVVEGIGIGSALVEAVKDIAASVKCKRLWLITTNDNINALRFYQKRGLFLVKVHRLALDQSRKLKPEIPLVGNYDIPLRDEIELEMPLWKCIGDEEPRKRGFAAWFFHEHRVNISPKIDTPGSETSGKGDTDDTG
jgi:DNA-3-methyladenine glycosylase I